jgi:hypothetical protein
VRADGRSSRPHLDLWRDHGADFYCEGVVT